MHFAAGYTRGELQAIYGFLMLHDFVYISSSSDFLMPLYMLNHVAAACIMAHAHFDHYGHFSTGCESNSRKSENIVMLITIYQSYNRTVLAILYYWYQIASV